MERRINEENSREKEGQRNDGIVPRGLGAIEEEGGFPGIPKSHPLHLSNSAGGDFGGRGEIDPSVQEADIGGILSQLRLLKDSHLAYVKAHEARLQARLKENHDHQNKILKEMERLETKLLEMLETDDSD